MIFIERRPEASAYKRKSPLHSQEKGICVCQDMLELGQLPSLLSPDEHHQLPALFLAQQTSELRHP